MRDEISTWDILLASGLTATEETLVLFTPYALITPGDGGTLTHSARNHLMFYGGPSVLRQALPPNRDHTCVRLAVGELIVPTVRLIQQASPVIVRSAITLGLVTSDAHNNPYARRHEYACVRTCDIPRLSLRRDVPQLQLPAEKPAKEVQSI